MQARAASFNYFRNWLINNRLKSINRISKSVKFAIHVIKLFVLRPSRATGVARIVLRRPENRGAEFETPKPSSGEGNGEWVPPPPQPTRGSGGAS